MGAGWLLVKERNLGSLIVSQGLDWRPFPVPAIGRLPGKGQKKVIWLTSFNHSKVKFGLRLEEIGARFSKTGEIGYFSPLITFNGSGNRLGGFILGTFGGGPRVVGILG